MARRTLALMASCLSLALAGCQDKPAPTAGQKTVTFNMSWLPQGSMGGVIAAIDNGYYAEQGLTVNVTRGFGGVRTVNELDQGLFEFGYGDPVSVILNRAKGGGVKLVGAINTSWPAALCYIVERHKIETPADLSGLTIGGGQSSAMQVVAPSWLKRNGVDPASVKMMQLDPAVVVTSRVEGKIDAGECWRGNSLPLFRKRAAEAGLTLGVLPYDRFGLDIYGSGVMASDATIAKDPALVRKFLAATYKGYAWAGEHPDETVAMMIKRYPVLDPQVTREQLVETRALMAGGTRFDPKRMDNAVAFLTDAYGLEKPPAAADVFTNDLLEAR